MSKMKNIVVNFCVDEDGFYSVEECSLGDFGYVECMMLGMDSEYNKVKLEGDESKERLLEIVSEGIDELIEGNDGFEKEEGERMKGEMIKRLEGRMNEKRIELGYDRVYVYCWGVEYDGNVGVVLLLNDDLI